MKSQSSFTSSFLAALAFAAQSGAAALTSAFVPNVGYRGPTPKVTSAGKGAGSYGRGLRNHFTKKQREKLPKVGLRDEHGAFTLVGAHNQSTWAGPTAGRRKWLAGISARRGY